MRRMPLVRFKDLVIDASDPRVASPFWAGAVGLEASYQDNGDGVLTGATPEHGIWVNAVPEPRTVKQRVHLDVNALSVDDVLALGATRLSAPGEFRWTVMADPEGGELCVFERDEVADYRLFEIIVDSADPVGIAGWWAEAFGGRMVTERGLVWVEQIPGAPFETMDFVPVPEPKTVKNRIHWDVTAPALQPVLDAGATLLRARDDEIFWDVVADPEGNEFCVFTS